MIQCHIMLLKVVGTLRVPLTSSRLTMNCATTNSISINQASPDTFRCLC